MLALCVYFIGDGGSTPGNGCFELEALGPEANVTGIDSASARPQLQKQNNLVQQMSLIYDLWCKPRLVGFLV